MKIEQHIKNLEKYCEDDIDFRSQTTEEEKSDFDVFCDNHIADIKAIIQELKNTQSDLYEANNRIVDYMDIIEERDRIIDLMAERIKEDLKLEYGITDRTIEQIIKYFEERCKDAKD